MAIAANVFRMSVYEMSL